MDKLNHWAAFLAAHTAEEALARHRPSEHSADCGFHVDCDPRDCGCGVFAVTCRRCGVLRDPLVVCDRDGCEVRDV